jgi:ABC-type nitrate/sulfonate/bicarbonate transport system substrate-binding protein
MEMLMFRFSPRTTFQAILIFLALTGAGAAEAVNLGVPNYNNIILPYFVAVDKGYYRDEGIELRLIRVNGARAVAALMSGDVHFDVLGATAITARYNGVPLKFISSTLDRPFSWVYARPDVNRVNELSYARDIFELSQDAWTPEGTANEREMKSSLDMSRRSLKAVRQDLRRSTCTISPLSAR